MQSVHAVARAQLVNTFELDDHPLDWEYTLHTLRLFHRHNRDFKATLFCVPALMSRRMLRAVRRFEWIKIMPHGYHHRARECHDLNDRKLRMLDELAASPEWGKVFKPPRYGYSTEFLHALHERGFAVAINTLNGISTIPEGMKSWDRRLHAFASGHEQQHVLRHCRYPERRAFGQPVASGIHSSMSRRFAQPYKRFLHKTSKPFAYCDELLQDATIKINIGCGPHYFKDWLNLDHRPHSEHVVEYKFPQPIPCVSNRAEIVYSSHFLNYVEHFEEFFLDVWRVLRPGGIYRLEEDDQESGYCWRQKGTRHVTGKILNEPTKRAVFAALERVGFSVREVAPHETSTRFGEVVALHTRSPKYEKKQKFVAEAMKSITIRNLARPYLDDFRAPRKGEYPYRLNCSQRTEGTRHDHAGIAQDTRGKAV